jgi:hypothetical protein
MTFGPHSRLKMQKTPQIVTVLVQIIVQKNGFLVEFSSGTLLASGCTGGVV